MLFVGLGLVLMVLKFMEIGPVAMWDWWIVLSPWAMAVAWWAWADWSGYTKRKSVEKENVRKQARIDKNKQAMGLSTAPKRRK